MSLTRFLQSRVGLIRGHFEKKALIQAGAPAEITRADWDRSLENPNEFYGICHRYFHFNLPDQFREHRRYFSVERRGFGEDAFHTMWFLLFKEFKPASFLEIGVWRGQTTSLAALNQKFLGIVGTVAGIAPFQPSGDSSSFHDASLDHQADTLKNFDAFKLPHPTLLKAFSTEPAAVKFIQSHAWDCIYIDGDHEYATAKADWENCASAVKPGGLMVLDDAGLGTGYQAPHFATAGIAGPTQVLKEIDRSQFREILQVGHNRVFQKIA
jgi:SAM-dependent methyltransferase